MVWTRPVEQQQLVPRHPGEAGTINVLRGAHFHEALGEEI